MLPDPIEHLLRQTDEQRPVVGRASPDLAGRIYQAWQRRRRAKRIIAGSITTVVLIGLIGLFTHFSAVPTQQARPVAVHHDAAMPSDSSAELAALRRQIGSQEVLIDRLMRSEQIAKNNARAAWLSQNLREDPSERAVGVIMVQADRVVRTTGLVEPAILAYDQVIDQFPKSIWADVARQRIAELKKG